MLEMLPDRVAKAEQDRGSTLRRGQCIKRATKLTSHTRGPGGTRELGELGERLGDHPHCDMQRGRSSSPEKLRAQRVEHRGLLRKEVAQHGVVDTEAQEIDWELELEKKAAVLLLLLLLLRLAARVQRVCEKALVAQMVPQACQEGRGRLAACHVSREVKEVQTGQLFFLLVLVVVVKG